MLAPLAIIPALMVGLNYGALVGDSDRAIAIASRLAAAYLVALVAGPLLAMVVRHWRIKPGVQESLVTFALFLGVALSSLIAGPGFHYDGMRVPALGIYGLPALDFLFGDAPDWRAWLVHSLPVVYKLALGGVFALRLFRTENDRWQRHQRKAELETARRQRDEADLRLAVLQAQVEPHFLFNTLASVRSLVASDPKRASDTIDALAEHLRATLPKFRVGTGAAQSTLGEQFAICESYLKVMHVRMGDRLRTSVDLPPHLAEVPFPPLMLISLVENAIKHGVEPKPGRVEVKLEASVPDTGTQRILEVRVRDDGVGLTLGMGQGTGLANIRAQLSHRFGDAASLDLEAGDAGSVVASIRIPIALLAA